MNYLILIANVLISVTGQFFLKTGINKLGEVSGLELMKGALLSPMVWFGMCFYGVGMFTWFAVLSKFDLSVAYPSLSFGYILVLLISWRFLGEDMSVSKIVGVLCIMVGIFFLFRK